MRRFFSPVVFVTGLALMSGCAAEQFNAVNNAFSQTRASTQATNANSLAMSAMATQFALAHVCSALAEQAAKDFNGASSGIGTLSSDMTASYHIDLAAGTGQVTGTRAGKTVLDLTFTFDRQAQPGQSTYVVHQIAGNVEGYQLSLPTLTVTYATLSDPSGQPLKDANGLTAFQATASSSGSLGLNGETLVQIPETRLDIRYPFADGAMDVGQIRATQNGMVFEGKVQLANRTLSGDGTITDNGGVRLYDLTASGGAIKLNAVK